MDSEIAKGKPLTRDETKCLLDLIEASKIITSKTTNATNNKMKNDEWIRVANHFNARSSSCPRTPQQLRLKWENMKKNARKRSTKLRMNQIQTGGGPADYIPPDDILDRVTSLLGSTASGFTVPFGGDREAGSDLVLVGGGSGSNGVGEDGISGDGLGLGNDARVSVDWDTIPNPVPCTSAAETCIVLTPQPKKLTFNTPGAVKRKKLKTDRKLARDIAVAEYFSAKRQCIDEKIINMRLENEQLKLKNNELSLNSEKIKLECEKLKLELENLRSQSSSLAQTILL